ncbi:MAG TPA: elongation factor G [Caulobacterales bacterium]|nr:elongation factor G [Caulobacterales bacterium]
MEARLAAKKSDSVRAVAVLGPSGAGKTTLIQELAAVAPDGKAQTIAPPGPTTETSITAIDFMGDRYVLIDTPGAIDFTAEIDYILPAVDLALVVADPAPDKAVLLQPFLKELERLNVPRALFINKIDQAHGRVRDLLEALQPASTQPLVARQIPIWKGEEVAGFVDLALERAFIYRPGLASERIDMPADLVEREAEAHFHLLEQLADHDDAMMEQLLSDAMPSIDAVFADLVRETAEGLIVPVFLGAASQAFGLRRLLKAMRHDVPGPSQAANRLGLEGAGAYVMKISHAGQAGKLAIARAMGEIADNAQFTLSDGSSGRAGALFSIQGGQFKKSATIAAGDIGAIAKIDPIAAGDVISATGSPATKIEPPTRFPVYQLAIATKDRKDDVRLSGALSKLTEEDPGLTVVHDAAMREILLLGQGEPHLRQVLERLKTRFNVEVATTRPGTPFRETIKKNITQKGRHKKQTGGHGQFGDCTIEIRPLPRGSGFQFEDRITGGAIPRQWIPAVEEGVREAMEKGPIGYPVIDVHVALIDGAYHPVDSSEHSFHAAGRLAMNEGLAQCQPVLLEPIEKLTIATPTAFTSRINSAITRRNGQILGFDAREGWPGWDQVEVYLPHAERQDLILELRSLTQGLASFEAQFDHMVELTGRRADEVAKKAQAVA